MTWLWVEGNHAREFPVVAKRRSMSGVLEVVERSRVTRCGQEFPGMAKQRSISGVLEEAMRWRLTRQTVSQACFKALIFNFPIILRDIFSVIPL